MRTYMVLTFACLLGIIAVSVARIRLPKFGFNINRWPRMRNRRNVPLLYDSSPGVLAISLKLNIPYTKNFDDVTNSTVNSTSPQDPTMESNVEQIEVFHNHHELTSSINTSHLMGRVVLDEHYAILDDLEEKFESDVKFLTLKADLQTLRNAAEDVAITTVDNEGFLGPMYLFDSVETSIRLYNLRRSLQHIHRYMVDGNSALGEYSLPNWYFSQTCRATAATDISEAITLLQKSAYEMWRTLRVAYCQTTPDSPDLETDDTSDQLHIGWRCFKEALRSIGAISDIERERLTEQDVIGMTGETIVVIGGKPTSHTFNAPLDLYHVNAAEDDKIGCHRQQAIGHPFAHSGVVRYGDEVIMVGGDSASQSGTTVTRINSARGIQPMVSLEDRLHNPITFAINNILYVCGGLLGDTKLVKLNMSEPSGQWENEHVDLPYDITYTAGVVVNNNVYIPGGQVKWRGQTVASDHLLIWTPNQDGWKIASARLTEPRYAHCVVSDGNDLVWVIGGSERIYNIQQSQQHNSEQRLSSVEQYEISSGTWTTKSPMPIRISHHACVHTQGMIIVSGGFYTAYRGISDKIYIYDVAVNTWSETSTRLQQPLYGHVMAILP